MSIPGSRLRDGALNAFIERLWDAKGLAGLNAVRTTNGLDPLAHFLDQTRRARRQLVLTSAAFDFGVDLPEAIRYVGPVLDDPYWSTHAPWAPPGGTDPLVLVAMSSTFQNHVHCLQRVIDALGTLPVRGLVTTGPAVEASTLRPPANVTVVSAVPHREVLRHAALVVTHGGHGTVMKTLAAGLPAVLLPHGRDQANTAARVTARGAGIVLRRTARSSTIARAIRRVLRNGSYRDSAQRLGAAIRRDARSDALVHELEAIPGDTDEGHVAPRPAGRGWLLVACVAFAGSVIASAAPAAAQDTTGVGSLSGSVADAAGAPVAITHDLTAAAGVTAGRRPAYCSHETVEPARNHPVSRPVCRANADAVWRGSGWRRARRSLRAGPRHRRED